MTMTKAARNQACEVREAPSFADEYALLDSVDRRSVDVLVDALRVRLAGGAPSAGARLVAMDAARLARRLDAAPDEILTVTDGAVGVDVVRRGGVALLLGAHGRDRHAEDDADPLALAG